MKAAASSIATLAVLASVSCSKDSRVQQTQPAANPAPPPATMALTTSTGAIDDEDITTAVKREMADKGMDVSTIEVTVTDGIVQLTGTVSNLLAVERAIWVTERIRGVRSISNRLRVEPAARADSSIEADVDNALLFDPAADSFEIGASVKDGRVELTGTVDSWQEKQLAERLVKGVRGVTAVDNRLDIDFDADRTDPEIQADVRAQLGWDVLLDNSYLTPEVRDGKVYLRGSVGSLAELRRAKTRAWVRGVREVDVSGVVVDWEPDDEMVRTKTPVLASDDAIERAIRDAAAYDPRVASFELDVNSVGGVVTLSGTVDNVRAKRAAVDLARHTTGVLNVHDRMRVEPSKTLADELLEDRIVSGLARNPFVESHEVAVDVADGIATLTGTVDSYLERAEAVEVAIGFEGIKGVIDKTSVKDTSWAYLHDLALAPVFPGPLDDDGPTPSAAGAVGDELKREIEQQLLWDAAVDSADIEVTVVGTTATLEGEVDSWYERNRALANAYEAGALDIDDKLTIR